MSLQSRNNEHLTNEQLARFNLSFEDFMHEYAEKDSNGHLKTGGFLSSLINFFSSVGGNMVTAFEEIAKKFGNIVLQGFIVLLITVICLVLLSACIRIYCQYACHCGNKGRGPCSERTIRTLRIGDDSDTCRKVCSCSNREKHVCLV